MPGNAFAQELGIRDFEAWDDIFRRQVDALERLAWAQSMVGRVPFVVNDQEINLTLPAGQLQGGVVVNSGQVGYIEWDLAARATGRLPGADTSGGAMGDGWLFAISADGISLYYSLSYYSQPGLKSPWRELKAGYVENFRGDEITKLRVAPKLGSGVIESNPRVAFMFR